VIDRKYRYSRSSNKHIDSTNNAEFRILCDMAITIASLRMMICPDFGISRGGCTAEFQNSLFQIGRSPFTNNKHTKVVTYCDGYKVISKHQFDEQGVAFAVDFFPLDGDGRPDYSPGAMALVATCFFEAATDLEINIDWGGSFKSISDGGHIELVPS